MTALKLPGLPFALEPAGSPPPGCRVRAGCAATFDHVTFRPGAPENLRDGS